MDAFVEKGIILLIFTLRSHHTPLKAGVQCPLVILQKVCRAHHSTTKMCFEHFSPVVCCEAGVLVPLIGVLSPLHF